MKSNDNKIVGTSSMLGFGFAAAVMALCAVSPVAAAPPQGKPSGNPSARPNAAPTTRRVTSEEIINGLSGRGFHFAQKAPVNFPVPAYTSNVVKSNFGNTTSGPPSATASIITRDSPDTVFAWYQNQCKSANWNVATPTQNLMDKINKSSKTKLYMLNAFKDNQEISVYCIPSPRSVGTMITINWHKTKS